MPLRPEPTPNSKQKTKAKTNQQHTLKKIATNTLNFSLLSAGALFTISAFNGVTFSVMNPIPNLLAVLGLAGTTTTFQYHHEKKLKANYQKAYQACLVQHKNIQSLKTDEKDLKHTIQYEHQNNTALKNTIKQQLTHPNLEQHQKHIAEHPLMQPLDMPELEEKIGSSTPRLTLY